MNRVIFHVDVNSAFLSWSAVKRLRENPKALDLRTVPSAVGGDVKTRHGVITAKSIPAKKYGVKTGEPVVSALRKCPGLILIPADFETYRSCSKAFIAILKKYARTVEQVSIDEAFLDMTGLEEKFSDGPLAAAQTIKDEIRDTLGFTVNVGISENKFLAKMASDFEKPDRVHTLWPAEVPEKLWPLPIGSMYGCGGSTSARLMSFGIRTIGEAAGTDPKILRAILGEKSGDSIWRKANGIDSSAVNGTPEEAKSYSNEMTTSEDITEANFRKVLPPFLEDLSESVAVRMQEDGVQALTIGVIVKTGEFRRHTRQVTLGAPTNRAAEIFRVSQKLMDELLTGERGLFRNGQVLRLVGVSAQNLMRASEGQFSQLSLFDWAAGQNAPARMEEKPRTARPAPQKQNPRRAENLKRMMQELDEKFGKGAVHRGCKTAESPDAPVRQRRTCEEQRTDER